MQHTEKVTVPELHTSSHFVNTSSWFSSAPVSLKTTAETEPPQQEMSSL